MRFFRKRGTQEEIRREAVEWAHRLARADVTRDDEIAFDAWLQRSPEHERQFVLASTFRELTGQLRGCRPGARRRGCVYFIAAICLLALTIGAWILHA